MKGKAFTLLFLFSCCLCTAKVEKSANVIIPQPQKVKMLKGEGRCPSSSVPKIDTVGTGDIPAEGYRMRIASEGISIQAADAAGAFYALKSLEFLKRTYPSTIPAQEIFDYPRFQYRGVHLDVSRSFRDKDFIEKQLRMMAQLKINRLHLHLVDAAGWRMQIDSYPKLTSIAAWRPYTLYPDWRRNGALYCTADHKSAYGGYYTKDELKEIVRYADSLHITVIPEIEMFGHSKEVVAAYPSVGCSSAGDTTIARPSPKVSQNASLNASPDVSSNASPDNLNNNTHNNPHNNLHNNLHNSQPNSQPNSHFWSHYTENEDGTVTSSCSNLCIGKEETFALLESVLEEVMEIFPSEYIHIGGDEASKKQWRNCPDCQERIRKEGLEGEDGLQSYGIRRIEKFVNSHGRKIIGWDEILQGGLAPNAAVMSWRGEEGGKKAAEAGHKVVMTPGTYCYLDKCQDDPSTEPEAFGGNLSLEKIYSYNPAKDDMPGKEYVMGVQTNLWTERIPTAQHAEHMLYPRVYALSEIAWTMPEAKDYDDFRQRALLFNSEAISQGYTPFDLSKEKKCREGYNDVIRHKAAGCKVSYVTPYHKKYRADGDGSMVDGLVGGWDYRDRWQGWIDNDAVITVDLGKVRKVKELSITFGQWISDDIIMPDSVSYEISQDGVTFTEVASIEKTTSREERRTTFEQFTWNGRPVRARFVRMTGHLNPQKWGWLFADELIVK